MSFAAHHHALLAAFGTRYGSEDFATYPSVVYPAAPLDEPRWKSGTLAAGTVQDGILTVRAKHNDSVGLRYTAYANTAGNYVRVLLDWYAGITDEERRIFIEVNGLLGVNTTFTLFYFAAGSAQVAVSGFSDESSATFTSELTGRPNSALALSATEPTWLELFVPLTAAGTLEARTWGQSQSRPTTAGYAAQVSSLTSQYGPISLSGQLVLRSINTDTARVRKIAILSTP